VHDVRICVRPAVREKEIELLCCKPATNDLEQNATVRTRPIRRCAHAQATDFDSMNYTNLVILTCPPNVIV
jgi:hypothetical protein